MPLRWDIRDVENHEQLKCYTGETDEDGNELWKLAPIAEAIIFRTMAVKMGEITEDNWEEFWWRDKFLSIIDGEPIACCEEVREEHAISKRSLLKREVKRLIGLTTNVITEDRDEWLERQIDGLDTRAKRQGDNQERHFDEITVSIDEMGGDSQ